jgi:hypothetical protein
MSLTSQKISRISNLPQASKPVACESAASSARNLTRVAPQAFTNAALSGISVKRGQKDSVQNKTAQHILSHVASPSLSLVVNVTTPFHGEEAVAKSLPVQLNKRDTGVNIHRLTGDLLAPIAIAALCVGVLSIGILFASAIGLLGKKPELSVGMPTTEVNTGRGRSAPPITSESLKDSNLDRVRAVESK